MMTVSKNIFKLLFLLVGCTVLWIGGNFFFNLYTYFDLSRSAPVAIDTWEIEEVRTGKFSIFATYQFRIQGELYHKRFQFKKPLYPNNYLAQDHLDQWAKENWRVWYNPHHPENSSLQKNFPFKASFHLILSLGVLLYFFWLSHYIKRMNSA